VLKLPIAAFSAFAPIYPDMKLADKIQTIAKRIPPKCGRGVDGPQPRSVEVVGRTGYGNLPVCMRKRSIFRSPQQIRRCAARQLASVPYAKWHRPVVGFVKPYGEIMTMPAAHTVRLRTFT
jgi:formate--tetrahydrofolate ligase